MASTSSDWCAFLSILTQKNAARRCVTVLEDFLFWNNSGARAISTFGSAIRCCSNGAMLGYAVLFSCVSACINPGEAQYTHGQHQNEQ
jgi:hypothetical protein